MVLPENSRESRESVAGSPSASTDSTKQPAQSPEELKEESRKIRRLQIMMNKGDGGHRAGLDAQRG